MMSIGKLSRLTSVKIPTIRYYEQIGLMSAVDRSTGNQRRYSKDNVRLPMFIRHARDLGITIEAIRELIELGNHPERPCSAIHGVAENHLFFVRSRIAQLQQLERIVTSCCENKAIEDCSVLVALSDHTLCDSEH